MNRLRRAKIARSDIVRRNQVCRAIAGFVWWICSDFLCGERITLFETIWHRWTCHYIFHWGWFTGKDMKWGEPKEKKSKSIMYIPDSGQVGVNIEGMKKLGDCPIFREESK